MNGSVRLGVSGAGVLAQRIVPHLTQEDVVGRVRLQAICDPVAGRAEEVARRYGIPEHFTDYAEMLRRADIHAVTIASPIGLHYQQGKEALTAGKHVHFNKTMTTTVAEATQLIDLARSAGSKIVASPGDVLRPRLQEVRRRIEAEDIGDLTWVVGGMAPGDYHVNEPERAPTESTSSITPDWYFRRPGGGPLYDTTVYALHELTTVLGPASAVTAMSGVRLPVRDVAGRPVTCDADDTTLMVLDFGSGLFSFVFGATYGSPITERTVFYGTKGMITGGWLGDEIPTLPHVVGPHYEMPEAHVFEDIMQLVDWVRDDKPSAVTAEHARHVIDIIESAYRSAETGAAQALLTTFDW